MNLIWHWMGLHNGNDPAYLFFSGIFADVTIFGVAVGVYRKINCHTKGCWRIALHHVDGTPYVTCRKHHPVIDKKPTHHDIRRAHAAAHQ